MDGRGNPRKAAIKLWILDVLAGKGRLLAVMLSRGVRIRIRWRGSGGRSGLTAMSTLCMLFTTTRTVRRLI
jgi:hypothetical protein